VLDELAIVQPRIVVVIGEPALDELNELGVALGRELAPMLGEIQRLTPSCEALYVPDIDAALDEESAKKEFWRAFRRLGEWYSDLPPY
jgi:uracil-DNA glycosylase